MTYLTLLAQVPNPASNELGSLVLGIAILLIIAERAKAVFWPNRSLGDEYVRRGELSELKAQLANYVTRIEMQRLEQQLVNLAADHKELSKSTGSRYERLDHALNDVKLSVEAVRREIREQLNQVVERITGRLLDCPRSRHQEPDCEGPS